MPRAGVRCTSVTTKSRSTQFITRPQETTRHKRDASCAEELVACHGATKPVHSDVHYARSRKPRTTTLYCDFCNFVPDRNHLFRSIHRSLYFATVTSLWWRSSSRLMKQWTAEFWQGQVRKNRSISKPSMAQVTHRRRPRRSRPCSRAGRCRRGRAPGSGRCGSGRRRGSPAPRTRPRPTRPSSRPPSRRRRTPPRSTGPRGRCPLAHWNWPAAQREKPAAAAAWAAAPPTTTVLRGTGAGRGRGRRRRRRGFRGLRRRQRSRWRRCPPPPPTGATWSCRWLLSWSRLHWRVWNSGDRSVFSQVGGPLGAPLNVLSAHPGPTLSGMARCLLCHPFYDGKSWEEGPKFCSRERRVAQGHYSGPSRYFTPILSPRR